MTAPRRSSRTSRLGLRACRVTRRRAKKCRILVSRPRIRTWQQRLLARHQTVGSAMSSGDLKNDLWPMNFVDVLKVLVVVIVPIRGHLRLLRIRYSCEKTAWPVIRGLRHVRKSNARTPSVPTVGSATAKKSLRRVKRGRHRLPAPSNAERASNARTFWSEQPQRDLRRCTPETRSHDRSTRSAGLHLEDASRSQLIGRVV